MKEKETNKLYNSMTDVRDDYIEEARDAKARKKRPGWMKWGVLASGLFLGIIVTFAVSNIFSDTSEKGDHTDAGIKDPSLDGDPNGYSVVQGGQTTDEKEVAEQDQADPKQVTESLPQMPENGRSDPSKTQTVISSCENMDSSACYKAPDNGSCIYSISLQNAMEEYGDAVLYKVVVDVFSDNDLFEADSEAVKHEIERLAEIEYTVDLERHQDEAMDHSYFVLQATQEQLLNFAENDDYGYMFWLYDERAGSQRAWRSS